MRRRTFLVAGAATVSTLAAWEFFGADTAHVIRMMVVKRLDYLTLDPDGVQRFAQDMATLHVISTPRIQTLSLIKPAYSQFALSSGHSRFAYILRHGEDRIVSTYLISSDFFINAADESRVVKYLGMPSPLRACGNPFARPPLPA
jgi:hypothetical protein